MTEKINLIVESKEISNLEQTLIENLNVYRSLIRQIKSIQPKLGITNILKKNICSVIGDLEFFKQGGKLINYRIGWAKNALKIVCANLKKEIIIIIINLTRNRLFHEKFTNNIRISIIGVRNG